MITDEMCYEQLPGVLDATDFAWLGEKQEGKVRDSYVSGDIRYLITSDRLSCFDVIVSTIPFKGQILNQMAVSWFEKVSDIVDNHLLDVPDPNVMVVKNCQIIPIEVIVRGYITGSAWRAYTQGQSVSGIQFPEGLRNSQKLPEPVVTPSTKAPRGEHDEAISEKEIIARGIVPAGLWAQVRETALALFERGQQLSEKQGLILVDTKYEFGLLNDKLVLADEVHTLDSSRFWEIVSYAALLALGEVPEMLDKEPTRQWLLEQGYSGTGEVPLIDDRHRVEIARHYAAAYRRVTGEDFNARPGSARKRIESALRAYTPPSDS